MKIDEMNSLRKELGLTYEMIAERADMPVSTVQKVLGGITKNPRRKTLISIEQVLKKERADRYFYSDLDADVPSVREDNLAELYADYGVLAGGKPVPALLDKSDEQGKYTIEDYYRLSAERRIELINGYVYDLSAPSFEHQMIVTYLGSVLWNHAEKDNFRCMPVVSPVDVRLHRDDSTMMQPDVLAVCEGNNNAEVRGKYVYGAPDFVIEVISPSTRARDLSLKLAEYKRAGVREYWIVDPDTYKVTVHIFDGPGDMAEYTFDDQIPVSISGGELRIDFSRIKNIIEKSLGDDRL